MKDIMPGLAQQRIDPLTNKNNDGNVSSFSSSDEFWSKQRDNISFNQLQKFWSGLSPKARQELLKIDKQTFFEQARKNTYCSRCNGLLLESFVQIVLYGKSVQQGAGAAYKSGALSNNKEGECVRNGIEYEMVDPSVHPWGGLTTTKDGLLTLLDCYLCSKSLRGLQNAFDSARARDREREMLYPDACGGGGRGWISQKIANYGRGHGARETCALHTARLSCDTLVDFWSALGEETRHSLLKIKEEDFTEKLMYRFESKRFCRDCRKNVIREFKELKELKRAHRVTRCTTTFCSPDAAFQYEVSQDTVQADWRQTFADTAVSYHHFEWAVGTGEGKSDIAEFKNVGMNGTVRVSGLDLRGLSACFITLRAWRLDGRCSELSVKANALKGCQRCVHCRLLVRDGYVLITRGESIRNFFEHAEEAEEEEDDDSVDNDENDPDGEYSRPLKHAKSPELAREFLLDSATVIFKEQVEKAFREGTARQNAHSIFVCLALKLLEERVHVACKEIITLEKQMKLLEEEEKEKLEEEERKERKRTKEREKKQRRKERTKGKGKDKEKDNSESNIISAVTDATVGEFGVEDKSSNDFACKDVAIETVHALTSSSGSSEPTNGHALTVQKNSSAEPDEDIDSVKAASDSFTVKQSQSTRQGHICQKDVQLEQISKCSEKRQYSASSNNASVVSRSELRFHGENSETPSRVGNGLQHQVSGPKFNIQSCGPKYSLNSKSGHERIRNRYENHDCNCNHISKYRVKPQTHVSGMQSSRVPKAVNKSETAFNTTKQFSHGNKYRQTEYSNDSSGRPKGRAVIWSNSSRDLRNSKEVWEPLVSKKYPRSNSDSNVTIRSSDVKEDSMDSGRDIINSCNDVFSDEISAVNCENKIVNSSLVKDTVSHSIQLVEEKDSRCSKESDNSSWLSEGDSSTCISNNGNTESSSTSDSEDASRISEGQERSTCGQVGLPESHNDEAGKKCTMGEHAFEHKTQLEFSHDGVASRFCGNQLTQAPHHHDTGRATFGIGPIGCQPRGPPQLHNSEIKYPMLQAHSGMGYYHQTPVSWPPAPASGSLPHPHHNQYAYAGGPFGYALNGNSSYIFQYDPLHGMGSPLFSPAQHPVCRPSPTTNMMTSEERYQNLPPSAPVQQAYGTNLEKSVASIAVSMGGPPRSEADRNNGSARTQNDNSNFSLFHRGIPAAVSTRDEIIGKFSSKSSPNHTVDDHTCNKESAGGEYNLFSSNNGFKISLF